MTADQIKTLINSGAIAGCYPSLYADACAESARYSSALDKFTELFGDGDGTVLFSVPGRSEIMGNHTDHNGGCVLAGAIDRDIIAVARPNNDGIIRFQSEGYPLDTVELAMCSSPDNFENYTSASLIAGVCSGFINRGLCVGGLDVYSQSNVLKGSGISSSAAYEVMIGNILNHIYNKGRIDNKELARIAQYAENVFFGKPSGLMDQMACAVGGFVYIDFSDSNEPTVESVDFSLDSAGYSLVIVNTGGNHADLNSDYASVPAEMRAVAAHFGKEVLCGIKESEITADMKQLRKEVGDRAILRSLHFVRENERVKRARAELKRGAVDQFLKLVRASGASSFEYLQNVYTNSNVSEQGLSLALALADGYMSERDGAFRVHGGGFAGTVEVFVKNEDADGLIRLMDSVFGHGASMKLRIRREGAIKLDLK